jgi:hypothetical protein
MVASPIYSASNLDGSYAYRYSFVGCAVKTAGSSPAGAPGARDELVGSFETTGAKGWRHERLQDLQLHGRIGSRVTQSKGSPGTTSSSPKTVSRRRSACSSSRSWTTRDRRSRCRLRRRESCRQPCRRTGSRGCFFAAIGILANYSRFGDGVARRDPPRNVPTLRLSGCAPRAPR